MIESVGGRYKVFYKINKCYYCGDQGDTIDHVPAISIAYSIGPDRLESMGVSLIKVTACRECNALLGDLPLNTLDERVVYLYDKFQTRYKKYLKMAYWDNDELDEIEGMLRSYVESANDVKIYIERRLSYMEDLFYDVL